MAEIRPLLPLLYSTEKVGDLSTVITPPYDVISPVEQQVYRARSPYSAVHIELPVAEDGTDPYERASGLLAEWERSGALRPTEAPAFFIHRQTYELEGRRLARTALLAGVRLEPWDALVVLPHERTFRGPKEDRLRLLRATAVAPSSIFSLYEQPEQVRSLVTELTESQPMATADAAGVLHELWAVSDLRHVQVITQAMSDRQLYIADGHHRYETALAYRDERLARDGMNPDAAYNYVAMSLVAFDDPGLMVHPTHRLVVGVDPARVERLPNTLRPTFSVEVVENYDRSEQFIGDLLEVQSPYAFVLYDGRSLLRVTGAQSVDGQLPQDRSTAWRKLELAALHELIIGEALGVGAEAMESHVRFTRDVPGAFEKVDAGQAQLACFVRPTPVEQLRAVADASDKMPQKSTYFYPKFPAGLVINRLDVELPQLAGATG